jgi:hypothetical protein
MTRDKAIQEQIDQCLDWFNFDLCAKISKLLIAEGEGFPQGWLMEDEPCAALIRKEARKLLRRVSKTEGKRAWEMCSYLRGEKWEGVDEDTGESFITLQLSFVAEDNITQDGTSYEAQPPKAQD